MQFMRELLIGLKDPVLFLRKKPNNTLIIRIRYSCVEKKRKILDDLLLS